MMKPPREAPPVNPRVAAAVEAIAPQHRPTLRGPSDPRVNPSREELRARADRFDRTHNPPANTDGEKPDEGKVLAKVSRPDGTELRVSLHSYEGKPYVRVGPWQRGRDGASMWPVKGKGTTVRVGELGAVVRALIDAMDDVDGKAA